MTTALWFSTSRTVTYAFLFGTIVIVTLAVVVVGEFVHSWLFFWKERGK